MIEIRTERLYLRAFRHEDVVHFREMDSDPAVQEFLGEPAVASIERYHESIREMHEKYPAGSHRGFWAAEEGGKVIGWFHLRPAHDTGELELGYRLRKDAWGRGLATEGSRALLDITDERVIARTMMANARSRRVMEKLGMTVVRTFPYSGEGPDDEVEYATPGV